MRTNSPLVSFTRLVKQALTIGALAGLFFVQPAAATIVQFQTPLGEIEVNLYDKTTPDTVANFLSYVSAGAYTNTIIHRSVSGFMVQGGGYTYSGSLPPTAITQKAAIKNEPIYSNLRGTIAMAKVGTDANSATNQWFFNLADNSANLDLQNSGFTVFGQVTGNGMQVIDAIAALNRFNMGGAFNTIPLRNYTSDDAVANVPVTGEHFMLISAVVVLDANPDTAANLNPTKNTLINAKQESGGDSGGSSNLLSLLLLGCLALSAKKITVRSFIKV
jgi:peptidyl-prolyl cis-trans isomerase A (cyclophilin A)